MAWHVNWMDSNDHMHGVSYSNKSSVLRHVEYCLDNGMSIQSIYVMFGKGDYHRCIFRETYDRRAIRGEREEIYNLLKTHGAMTVSEIMDGITSTYRTDAMKRAEIRTQLYRLRNKGLIERVEESDATNWQVMWRLKE